MKPSKHASPLSIKIDATLYFEPFLMFFSVPNCLFQVQLALGEKKKLSLEALGHVMIQTG